MKLVQLTNFITYNKNEWVAFFEFNNNNIEVQLSIRSALKLVRHMEKQSEEMLVPGTTKRVYIYKN